MIKTLRTQIFAFMALLVLGSISWAQFDPASLLSIQLTPAVQMDVTTGLVNYQYAVSNSTSSKESLWSFAITVKDAIPRKGGKIQIMNPSSLPSWVGRSSFYDDLNTNIVAWNTGQKVSDTKQLQSPPPDALSPGTTLSGFGITSNGLPCIQFFWARGWVSPPSETQLLNAVNQSQGTNYDNLDAIPQSILDTVWPGGRSDHIDAFQGYTIAPDTTTLTLSDTALIQQLVSLKHQSVSLGWISGPGSDGIVNSLDAKLSAAQNSISNGDNTTAANQLNAFINELDAQHGKKINDNAYFLLKTNAQFIINKLSSS